MRVCRQNTTRSSHPCITLIDGNKDISVTADLWTCSITPGSSSCVCLKTKKKKCISGNTTVLAFCFVSSRDLLTFGDDKSTGKMC